MWKVIKSKISALYSDFLCAIARWQHRQNLPVLEERDRQILKTLKREGVYTTTLAELGLSSTPDMLTAANKLWSQIKPDKNDPLYEMWPQIHTVTESPEIYAWATEKRLLDLIENYIGLPITFHGVHLRQDFPSEHQFGTLLWHSDAEDRRIIKIFVSLKEVGEKSGPFQYIPRSLTSLFNWQYYWLYFKLWQSRYMGIDDEIVKKVIPQSAWKSCTGPLGTVVMADTKNTLHHGTVRQEERVTLFFCYTANPPERPELCTQYWDDTFPKLNLNSSSETAQVV
ncbi:MULTISPECIES: phytanoyl-CoA dioxygenase [Calothrix]|uniref:Phytanoyl-CoA dioxygenase n=2 Tax=Calothrix TaxID=1186 RepID=A0ABR8AG74_9CYAN|nr:MULTISPECIES: phytanoyl-CoA dioxygenase [Calothrix]MBD2198026.1 phytanoyl-CoA dioxygenase [Calothrix parietina FACHB-288]MBD2226341.1 phytanoyl-CoA dioxygenase [Calothrix anomala FACHB-343]